VNRDTRRKEQDLERELRAHLELEAEEQMLMGLSEEQSRFAARRVLGNLAYTKEEVRRMWGWTRFKACMQDFRFAWRGLRKNPGFTLTAILTLAFGIGASTAVFTVVDSVVLKPLAYRESDRLVVAWEHIRQLGGDPVGPNPRHVDIWTTRTTAFGGLSVLRISAAGAAFGEESPRLVGTVVCQPNIFRVLGVAPLLGRDFVPDDGKNGSPEVAILTYAAWQNLFRGDPGVVGKTIRIDENPRQVVGVLPERFHFPNANTLRAFRSGQPKSGVPEPWAFLPTSFNYTQMDWNGNYGNYVTIARLAQGVSSRQAAAQLNAIQDQLWQEMPAGVGDKRPGAYQASLQPMQEAIVGDSGSGLWLLMAAVGGLMLIACLNLANAQLGRAMTRRRDAALRAALGAAKWRLLWSTLAENLLLACTGGVLGLLLAAGGLALFQRYSPIDLPRLLEVKLNWTVLMFSATLTIAASLISGMLPAVRLLASDPHISLQLAGTRATGSRSSHRVRVWLIGFQVFGCTALLLITGLFSKSLLYLLGQDKGFETAQAAVAEVRLTPKYFGEASSRAALIDGVLRNLRAIPGVQSAAYVSAMPLEGESWIEYAQRADRRDQKAPIVNARWVSPGYFETTRQRLAAGRFFEERDRNLNSIILSEGEAKALWGNENPIGGQVTALGKTHTVIGVVVDSRSTSLKAAPVRTIYVHYNFRTPGQTVFMARGTGGADALMSAMREAIRSQAPNVTVARVKTLDAQLQDSLARERFQTMVLLSFGGAALLLAMLGIYGILSYSVAARKQEIGVRMALGATRAGVYRLTMAEASGPVLAGLACGLAASVAAGGLVEKFLFGTRPVDAAVMVAVVCLSLVAAIAAAFLPARRAASVDPMEALRPE
jgi:predicted permease